VKNLHLLIYSRNYILAESVKRVLEETGRYRIRIEKKQIENYLEERTGLHTFVVTEEREHPHWKVSPVKNLFFFGEFTLDVNIRKLHWKEQHHFHLSHKETKILMELIENSGRVVTRDFLLFNYWGEVSYYKSRSLDVLISKLRKCLSLDPSVGIVNHRSEGLQIIY
jgi:DNA-binding response OmpR family regulator